MDRLDSKVRPRWLGNEKWRREVSDGEEADRPGVKGRDILLFKLDVERNG